MYRPVRPSQAMHKKLAFPRENGTFNVFTAALMSSATRISDSYLQMYVALHSLSNQLDQEEVHVKSLRESFHVTEEPISDDRIWPVPP